MTNKNKEEEETNISIKEYELKNCI